MSTTGTRALGSFAEVLHSASPASDRVEALMLYGRFVGAWDGTLRYQDSGRWRETSCEVHFGWVLEGKAIQDVWIAPARHERERNAGRQMYGTTLRIYDPVTNLWHIEWLDPGTRSHSSMKGTAVGEEIIQEYRTDNVIHQWVFTEITDESFHWISRDSDDDGDTWQLTGEFFLHRRNGRARSRG